MAELQNGSVEIFNRLAPLLLFSHHQPVVIPSASIQGMLMQHRFKILGGGGPVLLPAIGQTTVQVCIPKLGVEFQRRRAVPDRGRPVGERQPGQAAVVVGPGLPVGIRGLIGSDREGR